MNYLNNKLERLFRSGADAAPTTGSTNTSDDTASDDLGAILARVEFGNEQAVVEAHCRLQTLAPALFPARFVDGADAAGVGRALASLMLARAARQKQQTTEWIAPGPGEAGLTLSAHLTATGQDALLQSLEGRHADNAFAEHFTQADRYCLAGHLCLQRAATHLTAGDLGKTPEDACVQAADDYLKAAALFTRGHQPLQALAAYAQTADANTRAARHGLAGDAWRSAADILTAGGRPDMAAPANGRAATAYRLAAISGRKILPCLSGAIDGSENPQVLPAASYYLMAAHAHAAAGHMADTADAAAEQRERAADAFRLAAQAFVDEDLLAEASDAYILAHQDALAIDACTEVARRYLKAEEFVAAADAYRHLGFVLRMTGRPFEEEACAFVEAAGLYAQVGAHGAAADACIEAKRLELAAEFLQQANRWDMAGFAYEQKGLFAQAKACYQRASEEATDASTRTEFAALAVEMSTRADVNSP